MSELSVTTLKHESAGLNNLVLDSSGNTTFGGVAKVSGLMNPSGSSSAIAMDTAGRVTMPYQPMACASWTSDQSANSTVGSDAPYPITNVGNHLNAGIFTCPVNGVYRATLTAMTANGNYINTRLRFNGANYWGSDTFAAFSPSLTYSRVVISALVVCSASDTLNFHLDTGPGSIHAAYGQISFELVG